MAEDCETKETKEENDKRIHSRNSCMTENVMMLCFVFVFVEGKMVCLIAGKIIYEHKCFMKEEDIYQLIE